MDDDSHDLDHAGRSFDGDRAEDGATSDVDMMALDIALQARAADADLRQDVRALLDAHEQTGSSRTQSSPPTAPGS